ncbi:MAG: YdcF family protein [Parvibaculum sp.]|uniref:YdcF family protein n=1 Tax=Parvibaculum sp. TaxID=2024848 RepID=UPI0025F10190|nr:YdcF family protein [Parvibaculum sp.]MCE9648568.1 YdcF family protein [Parvibaculum sp.]
MAAGETILERTKQRLARALTGAAGLLLALYVAGFVVFAAKLDRRPPDDIPAADAIVALTGGEGRIAEAVKLLDDGKGERLLITGVHPEVKLASLKKTVRSASAKFDCCVDLGRQAEDTIGNASETAAWVRRHNYRSIILVTSTYHMPRAALELGRAMPGVAITPFPVVQDTLHLDGWWDFPGTTRLLISEYSKYLLTLVHARPLIRA